VFDSVLSAVCCVRFIAAATELPVEQVQGGALRLRTKLLHKYLAPIEAEVSLAQGTAMQAANTCTVRTLYACTVSAAAVSLYLL
jgi:hypothetical protein